MSHTWAIMLGLYKAALDASSNTPNSTEILKEKLIMPTET